MGTKGTGEQGKQGNREKGQQEHKGNRARGQQGEQGEQGYKGNNSPSLTGQLSSLKQHTRACRRSDTCERKQSRSTYIMSCNIKQIRRTVKHEPLQVKINSKTLAFL